MPVTCSPVSSCYDHLQPLFDLVCLLSACAENALWNPHTTWHRSKVTGKKGTTEPLATENSFLHRPWWEFLFGVSQFYNVLYIFILLYLPIPPSIFFTVNPMLKNPSGSLCWLSFGSPAAISCNFNKGCCKRSLVLFQNVVRSALD